MSKKPVVLFLPKWYPHQLDAFDGNFVENHAHAISRQADVCVLFAHSDETSEHNYFIEISENKKLLEVRSFFKKPKTPFPYLNKIITAFRYFNAQKKAYDYIQANHPRNFDLAHIHVLSRTAPFAIWLKKIKNLPFGITEHWSGYLPESNLYKGALKKRITKQAIKKASFVTTVSSYLRDSMKKHSLQNNYTIIPNVVDCEIFKPIEKESTSTIQILFVGNLLQRPKRILDIIEVFGEIYQQRQDFSLHIYGEGEDEASCRKSIKENGLSSIIHLRGTRNREEIAKIMAASDFLFLNSEFENQPCVINEAQACGLPVVVPDIPGIKAFMHEDLGILFPRLDKTAFKNALLQMMDTYSSYDPQKIRQFALDHFSEKVISQAFYELYKKTIST